jgi:hypothetical protein
MGRSRAARKQRLARRVGRATGDGPSTVAAGAGRDAVARAVRGVPARAAGRIRFRGRDAHGGAPGGDETGGSIRAAAIRAANVPALPVVPAEKIRALVDASQHLVPVTTRFADGALICRAAPGHPAERCHPRQQHGAGRSRPRQGPGFPRRPRHHPRPHAGRLTATAVRRPSGAPAGPKPTAQRAAWPKNHRQVSNFGRRGLTPRPVLRVRPEPICAG